MSLITLLFASSQLMAAKMPNICSVVNTPNFHSSVSISYQPSMCGFPPRPCVYISYYVPKYFIEIVNKPKDTVFKNLPGVKIQLAATRPGLQSGVDDDNGSYSFDAHTIRIPFGSTALSGMPCSSSFADLMCFSAMSEHLGQKWKTGSGDSLQPKWLLWAASPKLCIAKGLAGSMTGNFGSKSFGSDSGMCSIDTSFIPKFPPSNASVCTGWGIHFPRSGTVTSSDTTTASLVIASRIKSISSEVLQSFKSSADEKWQMILPQASGTFREGQNIALLSALGVNEVGRIMGRPKGFLYAIWQRTGCIKDIPWILESKIWLQSLKLACKGY